VTFDEAGLRGSFELREESFEHADWSASLLLPRAADELIDEREFEADERLPYWAELWPSARALARHLLDDPPAEAAALELGCGVALPALALRRLGTDVLATDWYDDALRFARVNSERNGLGPLRTALLDWRHPPRGESYPLVVAADVLYEPRNAVLLAELLPRVIAPGGRALIADPGRVYLPEFRNLVYAAGWRTTEIDRREEARSTVRIWELRRAG
jgi:predicted nicotinamide N-methyase